MIAALAKAQSLARIAAEQGVRQSDFVLTLTPAEAFELLDWLGAGGLGWFQDHQKLVIDIALAKVNDDPWTVLENFTLHGFAIASTVLH